MLHVAAAGENPLVTELLLDMERRWIRRSGTGYTPLHLAAGWKGNGDVVRALLKYGADVSAKDGKGVDGAPSCGVISR